MAARGPHKALGGVVHDAQLEALLVLEGLGQGAPQGVRGQHLLTAVLELGEDALEKEEEKVREQFQGQPRGGAAAAAEVLTFRAQKMQESSIHL